MVDIKDNKIKYFHFTFKNNLPDILQNGLVSKIGENAQGIESKPKVFFSEGEENACKCIEAWLKWFITRYSREKYRQEILSSINPKSDIESGMLYNILIQEADKKYTEDVKTGKVETTDAKQAAFEKLYTEHKDRVYLTLDLDEGKDFSYNDTDEVKLRCIGNPERQKFIEYAYGKIENLNGLEKWNMHTFENHNIPSSKIDILSVNDKIDGLSIVKEFYENHTKNKDAKPLPLFEEWVNFIKEREKQENKGNLQEFSS